MFDAETAVNKATLPGISCDLQNRHPVGSRLSRPEHGRSLGATVTFAERPLREAVGLLSTAIAVDDSVETLLFGCTVYGAGATREPFDTRIAWLLVAITLLHAKCCKHSTIGSIGDAIEWFFRDQSMIRKVTGIFPKRQLQAADTALARVSITDDLWDLLPYILEPHGHITRSNFEKNDSAKKTRLIKKAAGVYYTPSDVADFMVSAIDGGEPVGSWFDPACGTGVFLRAIVFRKCVRRNDRAFDVFSFLKTNIFAVDKSALATDLASLILLGDCFATVQNDLLPFEAWKEIKKNIACMDSLRLHPYDVLSDLDFRDESFTRAEEIFPKLRGRKFDHLVMNPPYATVEIDQYLKRVWASYRDISVGATSDAHLGFTEMLWRMSSKFGSAVAVLPLSVGTNTTNAYRNLREALLRSDGRKQFLFFDREPQALFGEDIKTRSVIVICKRSEGVDKSVQTSRLLKWTGHQRPQIFTVDRTVSVHLSLCSSFVPKLGTHDEAKIYEVMRSTPNQVKAASYLPKLSRVQLNEVKSNCAHNRTLLVSSTAYNFVNCFFAEGLPHKPAGPYSSSPLSAALLASESLANSAFAILSSRLCFWLWHVEGDGFHVTTDFLRRLPLWAALESPQSRNSLAELGQELWSSAKQNAVASINGGKHTYSFHSDHSHSATLEIDQVLMSYFGLDATTIESLDKFVDAVVSVDGKRGVRDMKRKTKEG